jgi:hypothetical protein
MAAMLAFEAIGPKAEELAVQAGKVTDIPVGYDPEFHCARFDSDSFRDEELQGIVFDALAGIDPDCQAHLTLAE